MAEFPAAPSFIPIAAVAVATTHVEEGGPIEGRSSIEPGAALANHPNGFQFRAVMRSATIRHYTLDDVVLDANTLLLFRDALAIAESAYALPNDENADRTLISVSEEGESLILGYNNLHQRYDHWLTQCLPAIDWSLRQMRTQSIRLLLPALQPWQEAFLKLLGWDGAPRLTPRGDALYRIRRLEFCTFLNGSAGFEVSAALMETMRGVSAAVPSQPFRSRVLYICQAEPQCGVIGNEAVAIELLRAHGVFVVYAERIDVAERIDLFRQADAVIGPVGPYLADVVFCRPGTLLWEWMPEHFQDRTFCCLAQAAEVDYWGDLFASDSATGSWDVDLDVVAQRLEALSQRLGGGAEPVEAEDDLPLEQVMLRFESLGDNCEFGLVQRQAGVERLGLLRLNGMQVPEAERLGRLVAALACRFDGLADPGTCTIEPTEKELMLNDLLYGFRFHTGFEIGNISFEEANLRACESLRFLRRKLFEDLENGDKIWVWKSLDTTRREQVESLLDAVRSLGPNTLLWVTEADDDHPVGMVEKLAPDFLKGYVRRLATHPYLTDIELEPWYAVCRRVDALRPLETVAEAPPVVAVTVPIVTRILANGPRSWDWFLLR